MRDDGTAMGKRVGKPELGEYLSVFGVYWWKIILLSMAVGVITFLFMLLVSNKYRSSAIIAPPPEEENKNLAIGSLANLSVSVGAPTRVEDLEALFKSDDLTVRVFRKYSLWSVVFPKRFDPKTGKIKTGWISRIFLGEDDRHPVDWDAIRAAEDRFSVIVNKRIGNLKVSFESVSPEGSAQIVKYFLEEAKSRLQEEAFNRAAKNKKFIMEQINKTVDALTRDRLYTLYGQEVEREMMAQNREQFGFIVVDSPRVPDKKSRPSRGKISAVASVLTLLGSFLYFVFSRQDTNSDPIRD